MVPCTAGRRRNPETGYRTKRRYGQCRTAFGQRFLHAGITGEESTAYRRWRRYSTDALSGEALLKAGCKPTFLLGARSKNDLLQLDQFAAFGEVHTTTEDGSMGEKGYVTMHSVLANNQFDMIYTCGPKPMMMLWPNMPRHTTLNAKSLWRIQWPVV